MYSRNKAKVNSSELPTPPEGFSWVRMVNTGERLTASGKMLPFWQQIDDQEKPLELQTFLRKITGFGLGQIAYVCMTSKAETYYHSGVYAARYDTRYSGDTTAWILAQTEDRAEYAAEKRRKKRQGRRRSITDSLAPLA